jgi:hypothetical protein
MAGSSLLATLITYKIRDNAAGLACGSCSCVDAEASDAEAGKAKGGGDAQNGGKKPTKDANGEGKGGGEEMQTWVRDPTTVVVAPEAPARMGMGGGHARPQSAVSAVSAGGRPGSADVAERAAVMDERKVTGLRQAKSLFDEGVLDEEEYRRQKAIILADPLSAADGSGWAPPPPLNSHFVVGSAMGPRVSSQFVVGSAMGSTVLDGGTVGIWQDGQSAGTL